MTAGNDMVERVAKAIAAADLDEGDGMYDYYALTEDIVDLYTTLARAAIKAMRDPTEAMYEEAEDAIGYNVACDIWWVMIDTALKEREGK